MRKGNEIKWIVEAKKSFDKIKRAIAEAHVLISPDFSKDFLLFSFSLEHTIDGELLQKDDEGFENLISYFLRAWRVLELKYNIMEKQAYDLIK